LRFCEDIPISFCSVEATKIGLGLAIKHVELCDTSHDDPIRDNIAHNSGVAYTIDYSKNEFEKRDQMP